MDNREQSLLGHRKHWRSCGSNLGQKLLEGFLSKDGISVKDLPAGMYLIQISGNFNEQILSTKFFKP